MQAKRKGMQQNFAIEYLKLGWVPGLGDGEINFNNIDIINKRLMSSTVI